MHYWLDSDQRRTYARYAQLALPRHTSYPIAPVWRDSYGPAEFAADLTSERAGPFSLYVHVPFCEKLCWYCACTKEIVPRAKREQHDPGEDFLQGLQIEAERLARLMEGQVRQVHLGGGSPTFLSAGQLERLWSVLTRHFAVQGDAETAIEIDPRITTRAQLQVLRALGFNRISLGIQDFDPVVQQGVNRLQSLETVARVVAWCREFNFESINFDLIYGLPFQTLESMARTLDKTIALQPDRIAFYRLAVIPEIFRWQNVFRPSDLPAGDLPLELNLLAINRFLDAGYEFIGLDHFARPNEALSRALQSGSLHRNFQGMTTGKNLRLVGLGPSAISQLDEAFAQNYKTSAEWRRALDTDLATERGLHLTADDCLRRELLQQLYGQGVIDKKALSEQFRCHFDEYFADELRRLASLADDGLVALEDERIVLTVPLGRLLVRVVAAVFDRYLPPDAYRVGLPAHLSSKVG